MKALNIENVRGIMRDCLFAEGEDTSTAIRVDGIVHQFGFNPEGITKHSQSIAEMLEQLPEQFHEATGGGWSFLNACMTRDGAQWGEHPDIEALVCLGVAAGKAKFLLPRAMWGMLPGGMPYFVVLDPQNKVEVA